jgi:4-amino-4-deoxy-L-arabinose transferase-like glycosyltransferase
MTTTSSSQPKRLPTLADRAVAIVDFFERSHLRAVALMLVVCFFAFVPGTGSIPAIDRDETRTTQASKQMLETGDFASVRFQDEPYEFAGILVHWMQAGSVAVARSLGVSRAETRIVVYRVPSFVAAVVSVLLTYWVALAFLGRRGALIAANMMAVSILLGIEARLAKPDTLLLVCALLVMGALSRLYLARKPDGGQPWLALLFWAGIGLGILAKGLTILFFAGFAVAALTIHERSARLLRALRPALALPVVGVVLAPWVIIVLASGDTTPLWNAIDVTRLWALVSGHDGIAPPGFYYVVSWAMFWPAAPLFALAAPAMWASRHDPRTVFLMAWLFPAWIALELSLGKAPHHVLPLLPAIAILIVRALEDGTLALNDARWRAVTFLWPAIAVALPLFVVGASIVIQGAPAIAAWPLIGFAGFFAIVAWKLLLQDGPERAYYHAAFAALFLTFAIYQLVLPGLKALHPAAHVGFLIRQAECEKPQVAAVGFGEPGLVFYGGTSTRALDAAQAARFLAEGGCRVAVVDHRFERAFAQQAEADGTRYARLGRFDGININGGRRVALVVFQSERRE